MAIKTKADGTPDKRFKQGLNPKPIEEVLGEIKQPKQQAVEEPQTEQQASYLTPEERAIADRVSRKDDSWQTITEADMFEFKLDTNPYPLPPEAQEKQDREEYAFRVFEMTQKRMDEVNSWKPPKKWWVCNRINTPFLARHCDSIHGGVQINDQILYFKPWKMHKIYQDMKTQTITKKQDAADINKRDGIEEDWGEWKAGKHAKIDLSRDEVMADTSVLEDSGDFEDLVA